MNWQRLIDAIGEGGTAGLWGVGQGLQEAGYGVANLGAKVGNLIGIVSDSVASDMQTSTSNLVQHNKDINPMGHVGRIVGGAMPWELANPVSGPFIGAAMGAATPSNNANEMAINMAIGAAGGTAGIAVKKALGLGAPTAQNLLYKPVSKKLALGGDDVANVTEASLVGSNEQPSSAKGKQMEQSPQDILNSLGVGKQKADSNPQDILTALGVVKKESTFDTTKNNLQGVLEGIYQGGQGVVQGALNLPQIGGGTIGGEVADFYNKNVAETNQQFEQNNPTGGVGRLVGQALPSMAIPVAGAESLIGKVAMGALSGAASGAITPVVSPEQSRASNSLIGAATGGALGGVLGGVLNGVTATAKGLKGNADSVIAQLTKDAAEIPGYKLDAAQLTGSKALTKVTNFVKGLPFIGNMLNPNGKVNPAALKEYAEGLITSKGNISNLVNKLQADLQVSSEAVDNTSQSLYNNFATQSLKTGQNVPLIGTKLAVQKELARLGDLQKVAGFAPSAVVDPAVARAQKMQQSLRLLVGDDGMVTPDKIKQLRSLTLSADRAAEFEEKNVTKAVSDALENDLKLYAQKTNNTDVYQAYRDASNHYHDVVVPLQNSNLDTFIEQGSNPDKLFKSFIQKDMPTTAGELMGNLSDSGKQLVQGRVLSDAFKKATMANGQFRPDRFIAELNSFKEAQGVIFDAATTAKLQGFANLVATNQGAVSQLGSAAITGVVASQIGMSSTAVLGLLAAAATSPTAGKILIKASKMNPGSPAAQRAIAGITAIVVNEHQSKDDNS